MTDSEAGPIDQESAMRLVEAERAQIAHDLHDALLPLLFASSAGVTRLIHDARSDPADGLTDQQRLERLTQISGWLSDAMSTGRELLTRTYPAELSERDWDAAAAETLGHQHISPKELRWDIEPSLKRLSPDAAVAAYRIVVEAVRNAVRHGKATRIRVHAGGQPQSWTLTIDDNGSGFVPEEVPEDRYGVRSMAARARLAGGEMGIQSQPGGPTTVRVCFRADG